MSQPNIQLSVKDFGPIREGSVEFKPLTVLIGPNNSGKSYMATLLYSLFNAISGERGWQPYFRRLSIPDLDDESVETIAQWVNRLGPVALRRGEIAAEQIPEAIRKIVQDTFDSRMSSLVDGIPATLTDYFACDSLGDLVHLGASSFSVEIGAVGGSRPFLEIVNDSREPSPEIRSVVPSMRMEDAHMPEWTIDVDDPLFTFSRLNSMLWRMSTIAQGFPWGSSYYLPAGRSGILQGRQLLSALAVRTLRSQVGIRPIEMPAVTGVAGDFLQGLLERVIGGGPFQRRRGKIEVLEPALKALEDGILDGHIHVPTGMTEDSSMYYLSKGVSMPIQRSSSMVAELAPVDLWIKNVLWPGDVLIIDEPEAHLHPENQRLIAQALVRLMNAGVKVVCATHSSMILHQISNHVLAHSATEEKRAELGFHKYDVLDPKDVGAYLFRLGDDGAFVEEIEIEPQFGIPEDEFIRIADEISDQTYRLLT